MIFRVSITLFCVDKEVVTDEWYVDETFQLAHDSFENTEKMLDYFENA